MIYSVLGKAPIRWELELLRTRKLVNLDIEHDPVELERFTAGLAEGVASGDNEPRPYDESFCKRCPARQFMPEGPPGSGDQNASYPKSGARTGVSNAAF